MDGTFTYCTKYFHQLLSIHGIKNGCYVPLIFCLLPNKEKKSYKLAFEHIVQKCLEIGLIFYPRKIVVDFELTIHLAIKEQWDVVEIIGCRFHLKQAWWRKIQNLGTKITIKIFSTVY